MARAQQAPAGVKMFDVNAPLTTSLAQSFFGKGYRAVGRYIPRIAAHSLDLTAHEVEQIHLGGLAILPTQHVEPGEWSAFATKGQQYGDVAATHCHLIGITSGVHVVLDLESVSKTTPADAVVEYANRWYEAVASAGFLPMIYLGWQIILSGAEAYRRLKFDRYWGAYNVDEVPWPRGFCIQQHAARPDDTVSGLEIDVDLIKADALGGLPMLYAPDEWAV